MLINDKASLSADYGHCKTIIKRHSKSFYYAFSTLPKEKANAVYAIYAFCRKADNSVDENNTAAKQISGLNQLTDELELFAKNEELDLPIWRALRDVFNRYDMDIQPFFDQLKGQRMDIDFISPATYSELEEYSSYVAGSVGKMLLPIIASGTDHDLSRSAVNLGIAMQITNILRDIGEDYISKNRIYIPLSKMDKFGYTERELSEGLITDDFIELWESLAKKAEVLYEDFIISSSEFDEDSKFAVVTSARVYRGILNSVRKNDYDCFRKKNYVSKMEMVEIAGKSSF